MWPLLCLNNQPIVAGTRGRRRRSIPRHSQAWAIAPRVIATAGPQAAPRGCLSQMDEWTSTEHRYRLDITCGEHLSDVAIELLAASDIFEPPDQVFGTDSGSRAPC
jgi:hypothetical protein